MCPCITYPPLIVFVNNVIITSVKVIIGSHIIKLAERPVTNQFCIEKHLLGFRFSSSLFCEMTNKDPIHNRQFCRPQTSCLMQVSTSSKTNSPQPPGRDLKGAKTLPRDNHCVQKPSPRDRTGSQKPHPWDIK